MPQIIGYIIAVLVLLIYAALVRSMYEINTFEINKINIVHRLSSHKEPTFVYFADLHGSSYGYDNYKLIDRIHKIQPDAILIGGDMIVGRTKSFSCSSKETQSAINLLLRLAEHYPIYYTFGNHETRTKNSEHSRIEFMTYLHSISHENMHIMNNTHQYITIKGTRFCIYGLEADNTYYSKKKKKVMDVEYITKCLGDSPEHNHSIPIVISHHPNSFDALCAWGAEYVLAGHNHGGFVRLPFIGGVIASDYKLFPKYTGGIYHKATTYDSASTSETEHKSTMLLTRGLGTHTIKFRLFNKPEVMVITFKSSSQP